jgi:hypothetical protein
MEIMLRGSLGSVNAVAPFNDIQVDFNNPLLG